jgi:hypothetical protein
MDNLYYLAYISKSNIQGDNEAVKIEVEKILNVAQSNNPSIEVTGALLYSGGYFCQVIEGPEDALADLFENIQLDPRHNKITVLQFEPCVSRSFSNWSMAFAGIEDKMRFDIDGVLESKDQIEMKKTGEDLVNVLDKMINQHQSITTS